LINLIGKGSIATVATSLEFMEPLIVPGPVWPSLRRA